MNIDRLKEAEAFFLARYPGGFEHEDMVAVGKKHRMEQLTALAHDLFAKEKFSHSDGIQENASDHIIDGLVSLVQKSTMVSLFEKPKFRDAMKITTTEDRTAITFAVQELLHGDEERGFNAYIDALSRYKLAKWTLATCIQTYFRPTEAVFVKPTTAKLIIDTLELNLTYRPTPTWAFYSEFRAAILDLKAQCHPSLAINNPAFSGFLMMSLPAVA